MITIELAFTQYRDIVVEINLILHKVLGQLRTVKYEIRTQHSEKFLLVNIYIFISVKSAINLHCNSPLDTIMLIHPFTSRTMPLFLLCSHFQARSAHYRWEALMFMDSRFTHGLEQSAEDAGISEIPWSQRNNRNSGKLPRTVRWRSWKGKVFNDNIIKLR